MFCRFCSCSSFSLFCSNIPSFSFHLRAGMARKEGKFAPMSDAEEGRFQIDHDIPEALNVSIPSTSETKVWSRVAISFTFDGSRASCVFRRNQQRWPVSSHGSHSQWGMSTETGSTACTLQPEKGNARFDGPGYPPPPSCRSLYELCCDTLICGDSAVIALFQVYMTFPPLPGAVIPSTCQGTPIGSTAAAGKYTKAPFPSADAKRLSSDTQGGGRRRASKRMTAKKGLGGVLVVLDRFLYIFAFIFPQRTCFGSNNRRWKGFGFFVGFRFCWYFLPVVLSLGLVYVFSSFYLACTSTRARKTKVATAPDHFFLASFTDHKKKEYVLESFILGRPHC